MINLTIKENYNLFIKKMRKFIPKMEPVMTIRSKKKFY